MRHGRAKAARKTLQYFKQTAGLQTKPYLPVLLDGCFLVALFQYKIPPSRIEKILQIKMTPSFSSTGTEGEKRDYHEKPSTTSLTSLSTEGIRYFITQEAVSEVREIAESLEKRKHDKAVAFREALQFVRKHCTTLKTQESKTTNQTSPQEEDDKQGQEKSSSTLSPQNALKVHIQQDSRVYVVATQDENLLDQLRSMGSVPIMRLANNSVLLLEQPSKASQKQAMGEERKKWKSGLASSEQALVEVAKEQIKATIKTATKEEALPPTRERRKKRKAKGPNPLSCKRKVPSK
jgi:Fcf1